VQAVVLPGGAMIVVVNLLIDILYADRSAHPTGEVTAWP
jgi:hypothetical protein